MKIFILVLLEWIHGCSFRTMFHCFGPFFRPHPVYLMCIRICYKSSRLANRFIAMRKPMLWQTSNLKHLLVWIRKNEDTLMKFIAFEWFPLKCILISIILTNQFVSIGLFPWIPATNIRAKEFFLEFKLKRVRRCAPMKINIAETKSYNIESICSPVNCM